MKDTGIYKVQLSASGGGDSAFHLEVDGQDTGTILVPSNGSWNNLQWYPDTPIELELTEGKHKIKFFIETANFNL